MNPMHLYPKELESIERRNLKMLKRRYKKLKTNKAEYQKLCQLAKGIKTV